MIEALQTIIAFLLTEVELGQLVGQRIAPKHQFSVDTTTLGGWPTPSKALQVTYVPGAGPDVSVPVQRCRLECRCYGSSQADALIVARALIAIVRGIETRFTVQTGDGLALVYWLELDSTATFGQDPDVHVDYVQIFLKSAVHETPVG